MDFILEHSRMLFATFAFGWTAIHVHTWWTDQNLACRGDTFATYSRPRRPDAMDHEPTIRIQRPPEP